jgi:hypothetical protein
VLALAAGTEIGEAYEAATRTARGLGIFGSPTYAVAGELFWATIVSKMQLRGTSTEACGDSRRLTQAARSV